MTIDPWWCSSTVVAFRVVAECNTCQCLHPTQLSISMPVCSSRSPMQHTATWSFEAAWESIWFQAAIIGNPAPAPWLAQNKSVNAVGRCFMIYTYLRTVTRNSRIGVLCKVSRYCFAKQARGSVLWFWLTVRAYCKCSLYTQGTAYKKQVVQTTPLA